MRSELATYATRPSRARAFNVYGNAPNWRLTPRELELAADLEMARGNRQRAELLIWRAHEARGKASA